MAAAKNVDSEKKMYTNIFSRDACISAIGMINLVRDDNELSLNIEKYEKDLPSNGCLSYIGNILSSKANIHEREGRHWDAGRAGRGRWEIVGHFIRHK